MRSRGNFSGSRHGDSQTREKSGQTLFPLLSLAQISGLRHDWSLSGRQRALEIVIRCSRAGEVARFYLRARRKPFFVQRAVSRETRNDFVLPTRREMDASFYPNVISISCWPFSDRRASSPTGRRANAGVSRARAMHFSWRDDGAGKVYDGALRLADYPPLTDGRPASPAGLIGVRPCPRVVIPWTSKYFISARVIDTARIPIFAAPGFPPRLIVARTPPAVFFFRRGKQNFSLPAFSS